MKNYTRKDIARLFHIGKETLRYYEKINLIPEPARDKNDYRVYSEEDILRIDFILKMKNYGFSLPEIANLIQMVSDEKSVRKDQLVDYIDHKIDDIEKQITELNKLIKVLNTVKENKHLGECEFFQSLKNA